MRKKGVSPTALRDRRKRNARYSTRFGLFLFINVSTVVVVKLEEVVADARSGPRALADEMSRRPSLSPSNHSLVLPTHSLARPPASSPPFSFADEHPGIFVPFCNVKGGRPALLVSCSNMMCASHFVNGQRCRGENRPALSTCSYFNREWFPSWQRGAPMTTSAARSRTASPRPGACTRWSSSTTPRTARTSPPPSRTAP